MEEGDSNHPKTIFSKFGQRSVANFRMKQRNFAKLAPPKVYGPFSKAYTMIFLILTDVADNASKFTLVGYEEH